MKKDNRINIRIALDIILIIIMFTLVIIALQILKECRNKVSEQTTNLENETNAAADITADWDLNKVDVIEDTEGVKVPVPKGFSASNVDGEQTVRTGFVIYETEDEVNEENKDEMQRTVNQFVWVQVSDVNEMYGCDINGVAHGKLYEFNSNGRNPLNWSEDSNGIMKIGSTSNNHYEPLKQTLSSTEIPKYLSEEALAYNKDFSNMISSVKQYGGFYIGRYETGYLSLVTPKVVKGNTDISNKTWNTMKTRCKNISNNLNVKTMMIFGCQWDETLQWLVKTGAKSYENICNSSSWGNFTGSKKETGSEETYEANNIYDLVGNIYDCTQEVYDNNKEVFRGNYYGGNRLPKDASYRGKWSLSNTENISEGCRATLYIACDP